MRRAAAAFALLSLVVSLVAMAGMPTDPGYRQQWGLRKIRAAEAWDITRGGGIAVAVIDTGVDLRHPDLRGRLLPGRDFVDDDNVPSDSKGHGTHVAGIIAALASNGEGVASVAPGARIIPIRVLDAAGEGEPGDVADGIRWAAGHGAKVINLSLAQDEHLPIAGQHLLGDVRVDEAIRDAAEKGIVVVVAAGNDDEGGLPETSYDATVPGVIVVGASTTDDKRAAYSNFGPGLDLLAPGGGTTTNPATCSERDWIVSTWWNPKTKRSDYGGGCGTSMAVAHVSGVAAMLLARGMSAHDAVSRITSTAVDLGPAGWDDETGFGRLDALRAVRGAPVAAATVAPTPTASTASPSPTPTQSGGVTPGPIAAPKSPDETSPAGRSGLVALAAAMSVGVASAHRAAAARARRLSATAGRTGR